MSGCCSLIKPQIQEEQCSYRPGRRTLDQLFILSKILKGAWEFTQPALCGLEERIRPCPAGCSVGGAMARCYNPFDPYTTIAKAWSV